MWVSFPGFRGYDSGVYILNHPNPNVRIPPIPMGDHPINLSNRIHHRQLQECQDLFQAVDSGFLVLWDPKTATAVARANPERDTAMKQRVEDLMSRTKEIDESLRARMAAGSEEDIVNSKLAYICLQVRENQTTAEVALTQLVPIERNLSESDLEYAVSRGGAAEIVLWARELLAQRRSNLAAQLEGVEASERKADVVNERRADQAGTKDMPIQETPQAEGQVVGQSEATSRIAAAKERAMQEAASRPADIR